MGPVFDEKEKISFVAFTFYLVLTRQYYLHRTRDTIPKRIKLASEHDNI